MGKRLDISQSLNLVRELSIGNAPPEYRERLAYDIKSVVGKKPVNIIAVDHGGLKQLEVNKLYLGFPNAPLEFGDEHENFRYAGVIWPYPLPNPNLFQGLREIRYLPRFRLPYREILLIMDDVATVPRPTTTMSALNAILNDLRDSFEKVYVGVTTDRSGFPNFAAVRLGRPLGPIHYTHRYEKELYEHWEKNGSLHLIGTEISQYDDSHLVVHNFL